MRSPARLSPAEVLGCYSFTSTLQFMFNSWQLWASVCISETITEALKQEIHLVTSHGSKSPGSFVEHSLDCSDPRMLSPSPRLTSDRDFDDTSTNLPVLVPAIQASRLVRQCRSFANWDLLLRGSKVTELSLLTYKMENVPFCLHCRGVMKTP